MYACIYACSIIEHSPLSIIIIKRIKKQTINKSLRQQEKTKKQTKQESNNDYDDQ